MHTCLATPSRTASCQFLGRMYIYIYVYACVIHAYMCIKPHTRHRAVLDQSDKPMASSKEQIGHLNDSKERLRQLTEFLQRLGSLHTHTLRLLNERGKLQLLVKRPEISICVFVHMYIYIYIYIYIYM